MGFSQPSNPAPEGNQQVDDMFNFGAGGGAPADQQQQDFGSYNDPYAAAQDKDKKEDDGFGFGF